MYKIGFYVPTDFAQVVKEAMFDAGAGRIGSYCRCSWQTLGQGQFQALPGSEPFVGAIGELHVEAELRVEMICSDDVVPAVLEALRTNHPYETPAYDVIKLEDL